MMHQEEEPQANRTIWWIVGSLFAVLMFFAGLVVNDTRADASTALSLSTKHETQIPLITQNLEKRLDSMEKKLDTLLGQRGISSKL